MRPLPRKLYKIVLGRERRFPSVSTVVQHVVACAGTSLFLCCSRCTPSNYLTVAWNSYPQALVATYIMVCIVYL